MEKKWLKVFMATIAFVSLFVINFSFSADSLESAEKDVLVIHTFKNLEVRSYHTMLRIDKLLAPKIEEKLMTLSGVAEVRAAKSADLFEIKIRKGVAFDWKKIEPAIINCIVNLCYNGQQPTIRREEAKY